jgi:hypothetical protein
MRSLIEALKYAFEPPAITMIRQHIERDRRAHEAMEQAHQRALEEQEKVRFEWHDAPATILRPPFRRKPCRRATVPIIKKRKTTC